MALPRFFIPAPPAAVEGVMVHLGPDTARHIKVLRLRPGSGLELAWLGAVWRADLALSDRDRAEVRLVARLDEDREPPSPILVGFPVTAQLALVDELLPGLVELGATRLVPIIYARSEHEPRRTATRTERWERLVQAAAEQSHRGAIPELAAPAPFSDLLGWDAANRWVAYELATGEANPALSDGPLALTSGPEGGITDEEFAALRKAGWKPVSLGRSILRAVTAPAALLGAARFQRP